MLKAKSSINVKQTQVPSAIKGDENRKILQILNKFESQFFK